MYVLYVICVKKNTYVLYVHHKLFVYKSYVLYVCYMLHGLSPSRGPRQAALEPRDALRAGAGGYAIRNYELCTLPPFNKGFPPRISDFLL